jgi:hypothetical protein
VRRVGAEWSRGNVSEVSDVLSGTRAKDFLGPHDEREYFSFSGKREDILDEFLSLLASAIGLRDGS